MVDRYGRTIDYLRISVTDRCNLRCIYCMPQEGVDNMHHEEILTLEEILRIVKVAVAIGVDKIKITGGEPLVRKGIISLIDRIKNINGIKAVTLTTNGVLFGKYGKALKEAGLDAVNFSLDCIDPETFYKITHKDEYGKVKEGIELALKLNIKTKINCVPLGDYNRGEIIKLAGLAKQKPIDVRFIELMPVGLGKQYSPIKSEIILSELTKEFGKPIKSNVVHGNGPAVYYDFPEFMGSIGFISAISHEFCDTCNRVRLTADGMLKLCLCYNYGINLKPFLRGDASDDKLKNAIYKTIFEKPEHHNFNGETCNMNEVKKMVQIGG